MCFFACWLCTMNYIHNYISSKVTEFGFYEFVIFFCVVLHSHSTERLVCGCFTIKWLAKNSGFLFEKKTWFYESLFHYNVINTRCISDQKPQNNAVNHLSRSCPEIPRNRFSSIVNSMIWVQTVLLNITKTREWAIVHWLHRLMAFHYSMFNFSKYLLFSTTTTINFFQLVI